MKNLSTGTGLALLAGAILAWPILDRFAPSANASAVTAAAAVTTAATGQTTPTIVWYGTTSVFAGYAGNGSQVTRALVFRAWSDGRVEMRRVGDGWGDDWCGPGQACTSPWLLVSDPAQGLTYRSDINFDEQVNGADLGQLLADWGNAPRQDIPPSDCPLALINP
jgi:hypothetical protein